MPLPLFPIVNCDHIRLFQTLREPEFESNLCPHHYMPFHGSGLGENHERGMWLHRNPYNSAIFISKSKNYMRYGNYTKRSFN